MKFADKPFSFYWPHIHGPVAILALWSLAAFILAFSSMDLYHSVFTSLNGMIIQVAVFSYVGYVFVDKVKKGTTKLSTWAGALTGGIAGFISAIFGILTVYFIPEVLAAAIEEAVLAGAEASLVQTMVTIGAWLSLVLSPIFGALIGALIAWIAGLITDRGRRKK